MASIDAQMLKSIDAQILAVDNMLLNAYGTVYKMAVKYISYQDLSYDLSSMEEMLSAKNIMSNLWSVLDYCCIILYYRHHGIPTPSKARKIKFPCDCTKSLLDCTKRQAQDWEKKYIIDGLNDDYEKFEGAFSSIQYRKKTVDFDTLTFYQLHFLRNKLTHNTIHIYGDRVDLQRLDIFQQGDIDITETRAEAAMMITVPTEPWNKENGSSEKVPLLDILFRACKVVEGRRDKLLHTIDKDKFSNKYAFKLGKEHLTVTLDKKEFEVRRNYLHLECYGLEAELKDELQQLRDYEHYN